MQARYVPRKFVFPIEFINAFALLPSLSVSEKLFRCKSTRIHADGENDHGLDHAREIITPMSLDTKISKVSMDLRIRQV